MLSPLQITGALSASMLHGAPLLAGSCWVSVIGIAVQLLESSSSTKLLLGSTSSTSQ